MKKDEKESILNCTCRHHDLRINLTEQKIKLMSDDEVNKQNKNYYN